MAETVNLECMPEVCSTDEQYLIADYAETVGRWDGWWAAFLVFSSIFGPQTGAFAVLPPVRFVDFVIVFMLLWRWVRSSRLYGGFILSPRIAMFTYFMLALTFVTVLSMGVNYAIGRNPFFVKDLYTPLTFIRMILIAAIAASFNFQEKQIRQLMKGILAVGAFSVIFAFFQKYDIFGAIALTDRLYPTPSEFKMLAGTGERVSGTFGNPNQFGGCLVMLGAVALAFSINAKGLMRYISIAVFLSTGAAVIMTSASRTALFGYLTVSGISFVLSLRRGSRLPAFLSMIILVAAITFVSKHLYTFGVHQRVQEIFSRDKTPLAEAASARRAMWINSLRQAAESPIIGVGPTKYFIQTTDNGYIYMILQIGVIGLLVYLAMLLSLFLRGIRGFFLTVSPYRKAAMLAVTMVMVNHAIFEITGEFFWVVKYGEIWAVFAGMLCGLSNQIRNEQSSFGNYACSAQSGLYGTQEGLPDGGQ
jgi:O-antigen ligase